MPHPLAAGFQVSGNTYASSRRLFPTSVIGSLPRPRWVWEIVEDHVNGKIGAEETDRALDNAVHYAIRIQEQAGLDMISDGEWRRENYARVFADSVGGFRRMTVNRGPLSLEAVVVERLDVRKSIVCKAAEFLRSHTDRAIMVALPSPCTIGDLMWHPDYSASAYSTRESFVEACVPILRDEISALSQLGVDLVQIDEPLLPRLANPEVYGLDAKGMLAHTIDLSVSTVNALVDGFDGVELRVHLCHAHGEEYRPTPGAAELMQSAVERLQVIFLAMEFNSPIAQSLQSLRDFPKEKTLGLGVVAPNDSDIETPELVAERVQHAMQFIDKERLVLAPDCGFATTASRGGDLDRAYRKLAALCRGAELLRKT
ncbi:MAG: cobalamin-independent methionine synthase II family protein [Planctomycetes bacterium]|nr:cobalamin-independent methionine synthase II family protein [Planctomycetota bacterium]